MVESIHADRRRRRAERYGLVAPKTAKAESPPAAPPAAKKKTTKKKG